MTSDFETSLLNYAFFLLSRRDYGEKEMAKKLQLRITRLKRKLPEAKGEAYQKEKLSEASAFRPERFTANVITRLKALGYLDDKKFARLFLESRVQMNPRGKFALRLELQKKGIDRALFEKFWEEGGYSEETLARQLLDQKKRFFARLPEEKRKKKMISLLTSRGFPGGVILDLVEDERIIFDTDRDNGGKGVSPEEIIRLLKKIQNE